MIHHHYLNIIIYHHSTPVLYHIGVLNGWLNLTITCLSVCLAVCHTPMAPSVLQGRRPQPRRFGVRDDWFLGP